MLDLINSQISFQITALEASSGNARLGPQLISGTIISIAADPVFADKVVVVVALDIPEPLNQLEITLII